MAVDFGVQCEQKKKPLNDFAGEIGFRTTPESKTPKTLRTANIE
jgi:hypothetical protein